jgi:hypothetical protein
LRRHRLHYRLLAAAGRGQASGRKSALGVGGGRKARKRNKDQMKFFHDLSLDLSLADFSTGADERTRPAADLFRSLARDASTQKRRFRSMSDVCVKRGLRGADSPCQKPAVAAISHAICARFVVRAALRVPLKPPLMPEFRDRRRMTSPTPRRPIAPSTFAPSVVRGAAADRAADTQ